LLHINGAVNFEVLCLLYDLLFSHWIHDILLSS
jgi:hypothetical protein